MRFTIKTKVSTKSAASGALLTEERLADVTAKGRHRIADKVDAAVVDVRCADHPDFRVSAVRDERGGYLDDVAVCCEAVQETTKSAVRTAFGK